LYLGRYRLPSKQRLHGVSQVLHLFGRSILRVKHVIFVDTVHVCVSSWLRDFSDITEEFVKDYGRLAHGLLCFRARLINLAVKLLNDFGQGGLGRRSMSVGGQELEVDRFVEAGSMAPAPALVQRDAVEA
jgi:hypothetical protein